MGQPIKVAKNNLRSYEIQAMKLLVEHFKHTSVMWSRNEVVWWKGLILLSLISSKILKLLCYVRQSPYLLVLVGCLDYYVREIQRDCLRKGLYFLNCSPRYLNLRTNQDVLDAERDYGVKAREM
ncbi:MAG: hypothetical protein QXS37_05640 [Candidatus Aenigmatarchaeota archaeon]